MRVQSIKPNSFPPQTGAQVKGVEPVVFVDWTLRKKSVSGPPASGVMVFMKAEIRRVLIFVLPRMLAETFQFGSLVRPPRWTNGLANVMTLESKVKSPWNPIEPLGSPGGIVLSMNVVVTGMRTTPDGEGAIVATGRATVNDHAGH